MTIDVDLARDGIIAAQLPNQGTAAAAGSRTVLPVRPASAPPARRSTRGVSREEAMLVLGAAFSSLCTTLLLFGRLAPLTGGLAFIVVGFVVFLLTYGVLVSLTNDRPAVVDRMMTVLMLAAAMVALIALASVVVYVLYRGGSALVRTNIYIKDLSTTGPADPLSRGGVGHALVGTLIIIAMALLFTVPLGVACSVFLNESRSRYAGLVRTVVTAMTALPSILAGLLIFSLWILTLGFDRSGLAAALATSIVMLPIIIRAADVVLRLVPGNLREAAAALGASQWRVVWHVVLPTARSGLTTSVILGVARGIGETAPVLLTAGYTASINLDPLKGSMVSLPLVAYNLVRSGQRPQVARGFATAAVLMILVLILFVLARVVGGRPAGELSRGQAERAAERSRDDLRRIAGLGRHSELRPPVEPSHQTEPAPLTDPEATSW